MMTEALSLEELRRAYAELDRVTARYFELYDLAPVGYCTISEQGLILEANRAAATLLGVIQGGLVGQLFSLLVFSDDRDRDRLRRRRLVETGEAQSYEMQMVRADGARIWVQVGSTAASDATGGPVARLVLSDITVSKTVEIEREHERNVLAAVVQGRPLADVLERLVLGYEARFTGMRGCVLLLDPTGRHLHRGASPTLPEVLFGLLDGTEIGPDSSPCGTAASTVETVLVADIADDQRWKKFKDLALAHGLHACWSVPILGMAGRVLGTMAFYFDHPRSALGSELAIIEHGAYLASLAINHHQTQEVLRESEERFKGAFDRSPSAMTLSRSDHTWVKVNARACAMFGYSEAELLTMTYRDITHPDDLEADARHAHQMWIGDIESYTMTKRYIHRDGHIIWGFLAVDAIRDSSNRILYFISHMIDVTVQKQAEESVEAQTAALRESEHRWKFAIEGAGDGLWDWDIAADTEYFSPRCREMLGYTGDAAGHDVSDWRERVHPDDAEQVDVLLRAHLDRTSPLYVHEYRIRCEDGRWMWIRDRGMVVSRDAAGRPLRMIGTFHDITERRQAEERLRRSEEHLAVTLQSIADAVIATDAEGLITEMNPTAQRLTGWPLAAALGRPLAEVFCILNSQTRAPSINPVRLVLDRGEVVGLANHTALVARTGQEYQISDSAAPIRDASGLIVGVVLVFSDVTEDYRVRQSLATMVELLDRTGELAKVGGWERDLVTGERTWSPETFRILEFDGPTVRSREQWIELYPPEAQAALAAGLQAVIDDGTPFDLEVPMTTARGRPIWVRIQSSAVIENGKVVKLFGTFQDITDRKHADEERARLEGQLRQAVKMESVGRLAGGVAHDFNNMLLVILGRTEFALSQVEPAQPIHADLLEIRHAAERSAALTRQLLAFARQQTVVPEVLDLNEVVDGMVGMLRRLIGENIDLVWGPEADVWPIRVDASQIEQILTNLCVNARDAIADVGRIDVRTRNTVVDAMYCSTHSDAVPGEYVLLSVSDNGIGMDAETVTQIFEPFFTTKGIGISTGLGLSTVYGAATQNQGFIDVSSTPGHGSVFEIYLPRHGGLGPSVSEPDLQAPTARGHETILLVEDEAAILGLITTVLEERGYTVLAAATPGEALRLANEHRGEIALLVTDVVMPEMNGRELANTLLSLGLQIEQLFMSGYPADVIADRGVLDEGVHFIQKPFSIKDFDAKVRSALDSGRDRRDRPG
jgi:PAS domain S-box-containing protein